jgi:Ca2+-binding RTX toxin-like protein
MAHQAKRAAARNQGIVGTDGDDYFLVTAPTAVDGRGGFDTLAFDFSTSLVAIHLDLGGLWNGGTGSLNGYRISNIETIGSPYPDIPVENSWIIGSEQDDVLVTGADYPVRIVLSGQGGDDLLVGGLGDVTVENANNYLNGGSGDDVVIGGARGDDLVGEDGNDRLNGAGGDDFLYGDDGRDLLEGEAGADYLRGGAGDDRLSGGAGDDRLDAALGSDRVQGGVGADIVEYYGAEGGVTVNLQAGTARESAGNFVDHLDSIEHAAGSFFADVLRGSNGANRLIGDAGDDSLYGRGGDDILSGGTGADRLEGGRGADLFVFGEVDAGRDAIADFDAAEGDRIDLSAIDAVAETVDEDAFQFVGTAAFSGTAGELRLAAANGGWEVSGDCDGDGVADFTILVASSQPLAGDFVL